MKVTLIAHTQLSEDFYDSFDVYEGPNELDRMGAKSSQVIALTAIRTCYSPLKPTEIVAKEGSKYFENVASDGEVGTEADRLFRHITRSGHTSTLEHLTYTFAVEGVSRALLAQLTRHRHLSFSVQSQRYVRMGSGDKLGGFDYVTPPSIFVADEKRVLPPTADALSTVNALGTFTDAMILAQEAYDKLRSLGVTAEDARMVLPNAAKTNLVMTGNLRTLLDFYAKRKLGNGAQAEIAELAVQLRNLIVQEDAWLAPYFDVKEAK